jgi:hypothetical protein
MAIQHVTYLDLTPEQRRDAAKTARTRLQTMISNPFLQPDQVKYLHDQMERLVQWERGEVPLAKPTPSALRFLPPAASAKEEIADAEFEDVEIPDAEFQASPVHSDD